MKPRLCLEIQDQGTIYGAYVKINEMSVVNLLINAYILLSDSRGDLFSFFKSDYMYSHSVNKNSFFNIISNTDLLMVIKIKLILCLFTKFYKKYFMS